MTPANPATDRPAYLRRLAAQAREAREAVSAAQAMVDRLAARRAKAAAARAKLESTIQAAMVAAILADESVPAIAAPDADRVRRLSAEIAASDGALPEARRRLADAIDAERQAEHALTAGRLEWAAAQQEGVRAALATQVATLAPLLARLAAIDRVRDPWIGARFAVPPGAAPPRPWSGAAAATKFIAGLGERLRAPEMTDDILGAATAKEAINLAKEIQDAEK